jgi:PTH2 family peptidyl-tRNA hydrolase
MSVGKIAAQVAHAAIEASEKAKSSNRTWWKLWKKEGQCKVVLKASMEEALEIERRAKEMGLPTAIVIDRGLTELPPNTLTCVGIGPAPVDLIDKLTGKLPLLK